MELKRTTKRAKITLDQRTKLRRHLAFHAIRWSITQTRSCSHAVCPAKTSRAHSSIRYRPVTLTYEEAAERKHGEWMPLLSLPKYLEVSPDHPIINAPYIKAPDSLIKNGGNGFHQSNGQSLGLTGKAIRTTRSQPQQVGPFASILLHQ